MSKKYVLQPQVQPETKRKNKVYQLVMCVNLIYNLIYNLKHVNLIHNLELACQLRVLTMA